MSLSWQPYKTFPDLDLLAFAVKRMAELCQEVELELDQTLPRAKFFLPSVVAVAVYKADKEHRLLFSVSTATERLPPPPYQTTWKAREVQAELRRKFLDLEEHLQVEIPEKHSLANCGEVLAFMALRKRPLLSIFAVRRTTKKREVGVPLLYEPEAPCFNCRLLIRAVMCKDKLPMIAVDLTGCKDRIGWKDLSIHAWYKGI